MGKGNMKIARKLQDELSIPLEIGGSIIVSVVEGPEENKALELIYYEGDDENRQSPKAPILTLEEFWQVYNWAVEKV